MAKKVYAIQSGFDLKNNKKIENVIVKTWAECLTYVKGVKGAKYKSFEDINDANEYLNEGKRMLKKSDENYPKDCLHVYVDGSYNSSNERYAYGFVAVKNNIVEYIESNSAKDNSQKNIRQIAGELKAAVRAVEYALEKKEKKIVLFHDYEGIAHHATGAWDRKEESSMQYYDKMQILIKSGIEIIFVKVDSHTGDLFNELVDEKCKECLNINSDNVVQKWLTKNIIEVYDENVKKQILSIAPNCNDNILIKDTFKISENELLEKQQESIELDEEEFNEIIKIYKRNNAEGKKLISKLLNKKKEKFILYLLELGI